MLTKALYSQDTKKYWRVTLWGLFIILFLILGMFVGARDLGNIGSNISAGSTALINSAYSIFKFNTNEAQDNLAIVSQDQSESNSLNSSETKNGDGNNNSSTLLFDSAKQSTKKPTNNTTSSTAPKSNTKNPIAGEKKETTYQITPSTNTVVQNGRPDLSVKILAIGKMDLVKNQFVATSTLSSSDRIAVKFEVLNLGTSKTSEWRFNAVLPTFPSHIFHSDSQEAMNPDDRVEFVIAFDKIEKENGNEFVINIDPANAVQNEVTKDNNISKIKIEGVKF